MASKRFLLILVYVKPVFTVKYETPVKRGTVLVKDVCIKQVRLFFFVAVYRVIDVEWTILIQHLRFFVSIFGYFVCI